MKRNLPFIIAIAIASLILIAAQPQVNLETASSNWWLGMTEVEQGYFTLGYITASWTWAQGIYQANSFEELNGPTRHVYDLLSPAATYQWRDIAAAVTRYYSQPDADLTRPIWQVIHEYATEYQYERGGL